MNNPLMQSISGAETSFTTNISHIAQLLRYGNPQQIAQTLMQKNPQFKAFLEANRNKTPQQFAQEHGINLEEIMRNLK